MTELRGPTDDAGAVPPSGSTRSSAVSSRVLSVASSAVLPPAAVVCLAAVVVGALVRRWQLAGRGVLTWQDTDDFLAAAGGSWTSFDLWAGERAPGAPALLKLVGGDPEGYAVWQAGLAVVCWAALAASVFTVVSGRRARWLAAGAVLAFSVTSPVTMWERSVLSESLALSLLALVVAAGMQLARGITWGRVALVIAALVPWLASRDTNSSVALAGGAVALVVAAVGAVAARRAAESPAWWARPLATLGAASVGLGLLVALGASHGERQEFPMRNVYEVRVLPYPDRVRWFADHGMPQADVFMGADSRSPVALPGGPPVVYVGDDDAELGEWLDWVGSDGRAAFARYVATHPLYLVSEPLRSPERAFNNAMGDRGFYAPLDERRVPLVDRVLALPTAPVLLIGAAALGWGIGGRRWTPALVTGLATMALAVPHGLVAWHSDGMETARHLAVPAIQLHVGALLVVIGALAGRGAGVMGWPTRRGPDDGSTKPLVVPRDGRERAGHGPPGSGDAPQRAG